MEPMIWQEMCGNGSQTGMPRIITRTVHKRIRKGHRAGRKKSYVAAPGPVLPRISGQRTGPGPIRRIEMRVAGFVAPKTPRNLLSFIFLPFFLLMRRGTSLLQQDEADVPPKRCYARENHQIGFCCRDAPMGCLPWIHRDPFDRLLIFQAISEKLILLTKDETIRRYPVKTAC